MILDNISCYESYTELNERFKLALNFINTNDIKNMEAGRYEIDGDNVFLMVVDQIAMKSKEEAFLEVHNKYIDIQMPLSGEETFGWNNRSDCSLVKTEFDADQDIMFFSDLPRNYINVQPGEFIVFFPQDAHAPLVGNGTIKKCIIKVLV